MEDTHVHAAGRVEAGFGEGEEIADLLSEIGRTFKERLRSLPDSPAKALSPSQRDVLVRIGRRPGTTPAGVSDRTGRDPGQVTRLVSELEALKLVDRKRSLEDRRSVMLFLSPAGEVLFASMLKRRAALSKAMLATLDEEEVVRFRSTLMEIRSTLREL